MAHNLTILMKRGCRSGHAYDQPLAWLRSDMERRGAGGLDSAHLGVEVSIAGDVERYFVRMSRA